LELIVYFPALIDAVIVCSRHGFGRSSGWVFTLILCLVRIVGACCQLATYHSETKGLFEAVVILDSIGISPLLLATLGLLSRCADSIRDNSSKLFHPLHFRLLQLLITIALILCIVGGANSISAAGVYQPQTTTKAGVVLYVVAFIILIFIAAMLEIRHMRAPSSEKRLIWAVILAFPFIFVRLVYSLISVFSHKHDFNLVTGSVVIHVFMSVLEEMAVVIIYLAVGWMAETLTSAERGPISSRPWKGNWRGGGSTEQHNGRRLRQGDNGRRRQGGTGRRRQGPIHALVGAGMAAVQRKREGDPQVNQV